MPFPCDESSSVWRLRLSRALNDPKVCHRSALPGSPSVQREMTAWLHLVQQALRGKFMLLIATGLLYCVHVAVNEEAFWTLSGFKYTIDVPHVTVNYHILRVAGVHWQKQESNTVALLFNWSSVGLRINRQANTEDHSSFLFFLPLERQLRKSSQPHFVFRGFSLQNG